VNNRTIISFIFIITLLSHLSHTYLTLQIFQKLIIKHCHYDIIIFIISLIRIIFNYCHYDTIILIIYIIHIISFDKDIAFLMYANLLGFCLNITHTALKASIFRNYPQTEVTSMCTEHFLMIRYKTNVILCALTSPVHCCAQISYYISYICYFNYLHFPHTTNFTSDIYIIFFHSTLISWPSGQHTWYWSCWPVFEP
jgi:hypothetical protein